MPVIFALAFVALLLAGIGVSPLCFAAIPWVVAERLALTGWKRDERPGASDLSLQAERDAGLVFYGVALLPGYYVYHGGFVVSGDGLAYYPVGLDNEAPDSLARAVGLLSVDEPRAAAEPLAIVSRDWGIHPVLPLAEYQTALERRARFAKRCIDD